MFPIHTTNPGLSEWLLTATNRDIELALIVGYKNVSEVIEMKNAVVHSSMVEKGNIGENYVYEVLRKSFDVQNVSANPQSGDLTLFIGGMKILVEVKNYTNTVSTINVEKFKRDLSTSGADAAVFISLHSAIANIGNLQLVIEDADTKRVPCVYVSSDDENLITICVNMVYSLKTVLNNRADELVSGKIRDIREHIDRISKVRNHLYEHQAEYVTKLNKTIAKLLSCEKAIRDDIGVITSAEDCKHVSIITEKLLSHFKVKYSTQLSKCIDSVVEKINLLGDPTAIENVWKISSKKAIHSSKCGICFGKTPLLVLPRDRISKITDWRRVTTIDMANIYVEITEDTLDSVIGLI